VLQWKDKSVINSTRGGPSDGAFPIVLSPRKTKLLSPYPLLRWTPVSGARAYAVIVQGTNFYWSSQVSADKSEMVYPEFARKLSDGIDYKLIVETTDRSSRDEPGKGWGFTILSGSERKTVEEEQQRIETLGLLEGPTQFLISYLYAAHDLNAEAIQRLESVSHTFQAAAVARLLGDLYLKVGLMRQAEANYLNSLDLCKKEKDVESEMLVHSTLARIYGEALGNEVSASEHFNAALALAEQIGDDSTADQTRKQLAGLKKTRI
jgi:tetratricopeptide (TPR) repeat protein